MSKTSRWRRVKTTSTQQAIQGTGLEQAWRRRFHSHGRWPADAAHPGSREFRLEGQCDLAFGQLDLGSIQAGHHRNPVIDLEIGSGRLGVRRSLIQRNLDVGSPDSNRRLSRGEGDLPPVGEDARKIAKPTFEHGDDLLPLGLVLAQQLGQVHSRIGPHQHAPVVPKPHQDLGARSGDQFEDDGRMLVRPHSRVDLRQLLRKDEPQRQQIITVLKGGLRYLSSILTNRRQVTFTSAQATIGIRGTDIEIALDEAAADAKPSGTYLKVNHGIAVMTGLDGTEVELSEGQIALALEAELSRAGVRSIRRP